MKRTPASDTKRLRGRPPIGAARVRMSITLERPQAEKLDAIAEETGVSVATLIRQAVDRYLEKTTGSR